MDIPREREPAPPGGGVRVRAYVAGQMRMSRWLTTSSDEDAVATELAGVITYAKDFNLADQMLIEVFDPDLPGIDAFVRFGTTTDGMMRPTDLRKDEDVAEAVSEELILRHARYAGPVQ